MEENIEESTSTKKGISPKTRKILNIAVDIFCGIILIFALIIAISTITSRAKGYDQYTEIFGRAYLAVQSDSMKGDKEDNFSKGDLIVIKTLNESEAKKLKVDDIITFYDVTVPTNNGMKGLNSHRIVGIFNGVAGDAITYYTHGDNAPEGKYETVSVKDIVGVYEGKAGGIGNFVMFLGSTGGFITFVLVPTLIIVAIAAVNLILVIKRERKEQTAAAADAKIAEREQMRAELMAEMGLSPDNTVIPSVVEESPAPENTESEVEESPDNTTIPSDAPVIPSVAEESPDNTVIPSVVEESPAPENTDSAVEESPDNTVIPSVAEESPAPENTDSAVEESPAPEEKPEQSAAEKSPAKLKPATKSAAKPTTKTTTKSAAKPTTKTTTKSAAKPTTKTTTAKKPATSKPATAKPKSDKK